MSAYGDHITRTLKAHRSLRDAGLTNDYETAEWRETASRVDRYLLWMSALAIPILIYSMYVRVLE